MTVKDSFVIGDVVEQHAGKSKVNSGHIGGSASRRCKAARLGTGYALEFASAGQGLCHCLPPACSRSLICTRAIIAQLGADCLVNDCVREANRARPQGGLHQHLNSFSSDAQLRLKRGLAQTRPSIQLCRRRSHLLWPIPTRVSSLPLAAETQQHLHELCFLDLSFPSPE
jgi:hypothetical protein